MRIDGQLERRYHQFQELHEVLREHRASPGTHLLTKKQESDATRHSAAEGLTHEQSRIAFSRLQSLIIAEFRPDRRAGIDSYEEKNADDIA